MISLMKGSLAGHGRLSIWTWNAKRECAELGSGSNLLSRHRLPPGLGSLMLNSAMPATPRHFDFDLAIIGGGSGGFAAACTAAAEGVKTVVIEGGEEIGGLCILRGCMPT